jgi:hypothetical protein
MLAFGQVVPEYDETNKLPAGERAGRLASIDRYAHAMNITDNYLRYGNISIYNNDLAWYTRLDSLAEYILKYAEEFDVYSMLLPFSFTIAAHEIAHLSTQDHELSGWSSLEKFLDSVPAIRDDEKYADEIAIQTVKSYVERLSPGEAYFFRQGIIEFAETMRDLVLVEVYDGFRGLDARDVLMAIEEKYPMPEDLKDLPFLNPARLERGQFNPAPTMTEKELREIIERLRTNGSSLTHQHLLLRAVALANAVGSEEISEGFDIFMGYQSLLTTTFSSREALQQISSGSGQARFKKTGTMNLSYAQAMYSLEDDFEFEKAISLNEDECWVGYRETGYIEICESRGNLRRLNYVRRVDQKNTERYVQDVVIMIRLLFNINPAWEKDQYQILRIQNEIMAGNSVVVREIVDDYVVSFGNVNNTRTIRITAEPLQ